MEYLQNVLTLDFWWGLLKIIGINILLSGDNALVIALAARGLTPEQQKRAISIGSGFAVVLRIVLTIVAAWLLELQGLQIIGGLLLLWIGAQLLADEEEGVDDEQAHSNMLAAIKTILIADLVMSLDNVIGVAAAAGGDMLLLVLGLIISLPLVMYGSTLLITLMERFAFIIVIGAALIGWVGGETIAHDTLFKPWSEQMPWLQYVCAAVGAAVVVGWGRLMERKAKD